MHRPARPPRSIAAWRLLAATLLLGAACTTEFATEGGSCQVTADCEAGEICELVRQADGGVLMSAGRSVGVCLRGCTRDSQCVTARNERCLFDPPDAMSGVCGRACVSSADCNEGQSCSFDRCVSPVVLPDVGALPDGAPTDISGGPDESLPDSTAPDGAATDARAPDAALPDGAADMAPVDMSPADMTSTDLAPADMAAPDMAPEMDPGR